MITGAGVNFRFEWLMAWAQMQRLTSQFHVLWQRWERLFWVCTPGIRKMDAQTKRGRQWRCKPHAIGRLHQRCGQPGTVQRFVWCVWRTRCLYGARHYFRWGFWQRADSQHHFQSANWRKVVSGANLGVGIYAGITITGIVGRTGEIQSSPNLSTWTTVATVLLLSSPYPGIDQNPTAGNRFYQADKLP